MRKWLMPIFIISIIFILGACAGNDESADDAGSAEGEAMNTEESSREMEMATSDSDSADAEYDQDTANEAAEQPNQVETNSANTIDRKIIYNGNLRVEVKNYNEAINELESQVEDTGGFIVESSSYGGSEDGLQEGSITARIPQENFQQFIKVVEDGNMKVVEKSVSGQDVTEEFVDLQSRIKSKRVVEERLLSFMEDAEKTEDLLKISNDLSKVQEEIEQITGRMNYLQNKSDLATVTIHIYENRVNIPNINEEGLNTWEKTKQQFNESINFLLSAVSGLFVFIAGNLPVLLIIAAAGLVAFRIVRKKNKKKE
ncbi:DUF4349 domain-containing protein [Aquibacillus halophilus]|uniref:DUF4349 domain-containing protein n=1 Tax=Aquibacillus halophilus TaxID=930132 RepID=A0A6A8DDC8_9BACI|nr:DUF4349 domain-containing protein [Aquibacillus halophilus]MRH43705.1 DUF4349 domain-containing protein [Aquibacillus halophilus]